MVFIQFSPHALDHRMGFRQVLAVGAFALAQIRHCIQTHAINACIEPEPHHLHDGVEDMRAGEIQVRLVGKKAVPVIGLGYLVPLPVGSPYVSENAARATVLGVVVAPDIVVALGGTLWRTPRRLEPGMLVRSVVDYQFGDYAANPGDALR